VKWLALYSVGNRQPTAFAKQPGDIPDVPSLPNALKQLQALGARNVEAPTGNGLCPEGNLAGLRSLDKAPSLLPLTLLFC